MYICDQCKESSRPSEPMTKVVVETRYRQYDDGGIGYETARESKRCPRCVLGLGVGLKTDTTNASATVPL